VQTWISPQECFFIPLPRPCLLPPLLRLPVRNGHFLQEDEWPRAVRRLGASPSLRPAPPPRRLLRIDCPPFLPSFSLPSFDPVTPQSHLTQVRLLAAQYPPRLARVMVCVKYSDFSERHQSGVILIGSIFRVVIITLPHRKQIPSFLVPRTPFCFPTAESESSQFHPPGFF